MSLWIYSHPKMTLTTLVTVKKDYNNLLWNFFLLISNIYVPIRHMIHFEIPKQQEAVVEEEYNFTPLYIYISIFSYVF